jgi:hypothetical protein
MWSFISLYSLPIKLKEMEILHKCERWEIRTKLMSIKLKRRDRLGDLKVDGSKILNWIVEYECIG